MYYYVEYKMLKCFMFYNLEIQSRYALWSEFPPKNPSADSEAIHAPVYTYSLF